MVNITGIITRVQVRYTITPSITVILTFTLDSVSLCERKNQIVDFTLESHKTQHTEQRKKKKKRKRKRKKEREREREREREASY